MGVEGTVSVDTLLSEPGNEPGEDGTTCAGAVVTGVASSETGDDGSTRSGVVISKAASSESGDGVFLSGWPGSSIM